MAIKISSKTRLSLLASALAMCVGPMFATTQAQAETFYLSNPSERVVGQPFFFKTRFKDTLLDVARQNSLGYDDMRSANPKVDVWLPGKGAEALVPTASIIPNAPRQGIVVNLAEKKLYYFPADRPNEIRIYPVATGSKETSTPVGSYNIIQKRENPTWTPPASIRARHAAMGDILPAVVAPGPDNPLGNYAMRLSNPSYLIHGTNRPWGMGLEVSGGCIRMYPEGIKELYSLVPEKTLVTIVDQPYKLAWKGDQLFLEVHVDDNRPRIGDRSIIPQELASQPGVHIDWDAVQRVNKAALGVPQVIGHRNASGAQVASTPQLLF